MKTIPFALTLACCLLIEGLFVQAQSQFDTSYLSLNILLDRVERLYPDVLMFNDRAKAYVAEAEGANAWMPPLITAGVDRFPYLLDNLSDTTAMNQAGLMLSFTQMIPNPSKTRSKSDYLQSLALVQTRKGEWTKHELRTIAKQLYYTRHIADKKLETLASNIELLDFVIRVSEERYRYRQSELASIYKAKAKREELYNMMLMENSAIAECSIGMNTLLQRNLATQFTVDTAIALKDIQQIDTTVIESRSDVQAMICMVSSMRLEQAYTEKQLDPDFGIEFRHMQMFAMPNQFSVMGMISVPIAPWSSKMYTASSESLNLQINATINEIESMKLMAKRMANDKFVKLSYARDILSGFIRDILPAYQKSLDANLLAFSQSEGRLFELLDAWEMVLMKRLAYFNELHKALLLQTEYEYEMEIR